MTHQRHVLLLHHWSLTLSLNCITRRHSPEPSTLCAIDKRYCKIKHKPICKVLLSYIEKGEGRTNATKHRPLSFLLRRAECVFRDNDQGWCCSDTTQRVIVSWPFYRERERKCNQLNTNWPFNRNKSLLMIKPIGFPIYKRPGTSSLFVGLLPNPE